MSPGGGVDSVVLRDLSITYRSGVDAVRDLSFTVGEGEFVAIVGPSGCGKSTLLNGIADLLDPAVATIRGKVFLNASRIGYVFQRDSLLPWRTILENVEVGLEIQRAGARERRDRAHQLLKQFGLAGFEQAYPHQLSGGMRQRVALARTLAYDPDVILMDEPFASIDAQNRVLLQAELIRIWNETHKSVLLITHDLAEAITVAERVLLFTHRPATIRAEYAIR